MAMDAGAATGLSAVAPERHECCLRHRECRRWRHLGQPASDAAFSAAAPKLLEFRKSPTEVPDGFPRGSGCQETFGGRPRRQAALSAASWKRLLTREPRAGRLGRARTARIRASRSARGRRRSGSLSQMPLSAAVAAEARSPGQVEAEILSLREACGPRPWPCSTGPAAVRPRIRRGRVPGGPSSVNRPSSTPWRYG